MSEGVYIIQRNKSVIVRTRSAINLLPNLVPFAFVATEGQTEFVLNSTPSQLIFVAINGAVQSVVKGDYTIDEDTITLDEGVNAGDNVVGVYY